MKVCKKCNTEKPKTEFSKCKGKKDGLQYNCKSCVREYKAVHYAVNADAIKEKQREYRADNQYKNKERNRSYRADNAEKLAEKKRYRYSVNAEAVLASQRAYYAENTEKIAAKNLAWRKENPEKVAALHRNRRAQKRSAKGNHTADDVKAIFESQRGLCASCPKKLIKSGKNRYHVDHIQPLSKGGSNDKYNLQCLCSTCNQRKHAKDPLDWAKENGKLI